MYLGIVNSATLGTTMLRSALKRTGERRTGQRGRFGRQSPDQRFDAMLAQCLQWEEELGCGPDACELDEGDGDGEDGRLLQVLKGSFAGARCQPVADALRVCYLEYSPLRLGGDLIFKLLKRVVAAQTSKS